MSDRARAIDILKKARELLSDRLTNRIVEMEDELLDDAFGFSYMGEIETLHEQIGARLLHVNQMLSSLPPDPNGAAGGSGAGDDPWVDDADWGPIDVAPGPPALLHETAVEQMLVLPAPHVAEAFGPPPQPISLQTFAALIMVGDVDTAARSLDVLFQSRRELSLRCARRFHERFLQDPHMLMKAMRLRQAATDENNIEALALLHECFGLIGHEAVGVLNQLQRYYGGKN